MDVRPVFGQAQQGTHPQPTVTADSSRREKTAEFVSSVVPTALKAGVAEFQAAQVASTSTSTATAASTIGTTGTSTTGAAAGSSALGAAGTGAVGTAVSVIGGVVGAYNIATQWGKSTPTQGAMSGAAVGASIGTLIFPGPGTIIGAGVGAIVGGLLGSIHVGKHKDQVARDSVREVLQKNGVVDKDYKLLLADGSSYDIGRDGGAKDDKTGGRPYEVDLSNPLATSAVSWINPLMELFCGGNEKLKTDFTGYFANAAIQHASSEDDVRKNVSGILQKFGVTDQALTDAIIQGGRAGTIPKDRAAAYLNGIRDRIEGSTTPKGAPA